MGLFKSVAVWANYFLKGLVGSRRFVLLTPPHARHQWLYDKQRRALVDAHIRDVDDWVQLEHIFLNEEFRLSGTAREPQVARLLQSIKQQGLAPLIVDLGSNIGLASKYFEHVYPGAKLIAVEPDSGNCDIARRNMSDDATLHMAAISSENGTGRLIDMGRNNAFRVDRVGENEGGVRFLTVHDILRSAQNASPFLIKIDIEGFERDLFEKNTDWIDQFPILLIELHDWMIPQGRVTRNFLREIAARDRDFMHFNGYVVSMSPSLV